VTETVQRGNRPVFVFGSLLSQRRFTAANFALPALNHPDPITSLIAPDIDLAGILDAWRPSPSV
jgi:hypothetical protein